MKEAVIMTREEYKEFHDNFQKLKDKLEDARIDNMVLQDMLDCAERRINNLWDLLNRPAIETAEKEGNDEFYSWCEEVSHKYERIDEQEWMLDRARFYNNGMYRYAANHSLGCSCKEVELQRKYEDWNTTAPSENENSTATEGWSELKLPAGWEEPTTWYWFTHFNITQGWDSTESKNIYNELAVLTEKKRWP